MITDPAVERYCIQHSTEESPMLRAIREYTCAHLTGAHMLSGILVARLLQFFIRSMRASFVVDLGTFTGYSALAMAEVLESGKILTCDRSIQHLDIAQSFFAKSPHGNKIEVFAGQAEDCLTSIHVPIQLVFIDADKSQIQKYIDLAYPRLVKNGIIVIDNVLWAGEVLTPDTKRTMGLDALNKSVSQDKRFMNVVLPVRDGLNVLMKS